MSNLADHIQLEPVCPMCGINLSYQPNRIYCGTGCKRKAERLRESTGKAGPFCPEVRARDARRAHYQKLTQGTND